MRLCAKCGRLSPTGSDFCVGCGGSFRGRRCGKGHVNPPSATHCSTCGSGDLTSYAPSTRLGWIPRLLTLLLLATVVRIGIGFLPGGVSQINLHAMSELFAAERLRAWLLMNRLLGAAILTALFLLVSSFLLGKHRSIFAPLFKLLIWIVRVVITLARVVLEGLGTLLHLSKSKGKGH